jgi:hypothetical protein
MSSYLGRQFGDNNRVDLPAFFSKGGNKALKVRS